MCMLTYFPPMVQPDVKALANGAYTNDDGHGYAIVVPAYGSAKARLIVRHSMDSDTLIAQFKADRAKYPYGPALFHSRWGTSGIYGVYNCHPFTVNGDQRTVVAHNGVLPHAMQPDKNDIRCDTRMAADEIFFSAYGHLAFPNAQSRLADAIGAGNKLVILTIDPQFNTHSILINEKSGVWETDGIWYSNHDYVSRGTKFSAYSYGGWQSYGDDADDWPTPTTRKQDTTCPVCKAVDGVDIDEQVCIFCQTCLDCFEDIEDCLCYWSFSGFPKNDHEHEQPYSEAAVIAEYLMQESRKRYEAIALGPVGRKYL